MKNLLTQCIDNNYLISYSMCAVCLTVHVGRNGLLKHYMLNHAQDLNNDNDEQYAVINVVEDCLGLSGGLLSQLAPDILPGYDPKDCDEFGMWMLIGHDV